MSVPDIVNYGFLSLEALLTVSCTGYGGGCQRLVVAGGVSWTVSHPTGFFVVSDCAFPLTGWSTRPSTGGGVLPQHEEQQLLVDERRYMDGQHTQTYSLRSANYTQYCAHTHKACARGGRRRLAAPHGMPARMVLTTASQGHVTASAAVL